MGVGMFVVVLITLGFAVSRFLVPVSGKVEKKDVYKDLAHVFVGGLFGAAFYAWSDAFMWFLAIGLTAVELVAFVARKAPPAEPSAESPVIMQGVREAFRPTGPIPYDGV